jgi:hypothetical protein
MSSVLTKAKDLVGSRIAIKHEDYGVVVDVISVVKNDVAFIVVVTDKNRRVEASSLLKSLTSYSSQKVYPDGSAYSKRFVGPKAAYKANPVLVSGVPNIAKINGQSVSITSHLSSSDVCDSDNTGGK